MWKDSFQGVGYQKPKGSDLQESGNQSEPYDYTNLLPGENSHIIAQGRGN